MTWGQAVEDRGFLMRSPDPVGDRESHKAENSGGDLSCTKDVITAIIYCIHFMFLTLC